MASRPPPAITTDSVLREWQYDPLLVPTDADEILALASPARPSVLNANRVLWLQQSPVVRSWLTVDESSILLVNGNGDARCPSTTVFSASIFRSLLRRGGGEGNSAITLIPLAYFCTRHQDYRRDPAASPSELVLSLLLQLVERYGLFQPVDLHDCFHRMDPHDVKSIFASLKRLIRLLPDNAVVWLIIEGLHSFSAPRDREAEMRTLVEDLVSLFPQECPATLKFMFTSPTRSGSVEDLFDADEVIHMPNNPPPAGGEPWGRLI